MTTRLILVCHAATQATRGAVFPRDEPIETRERARCGALVPLLGAPDTSWTGPERRCRETAEWLELAAAIAGELRDCDYGRWAGRSLRAIGEEDAAGLADWIGDPAAAPHGGESLLALLERVGRWLAALPEGRILAVTHASVVRAALVTALAAPPEAFWRLDIVPLSRTELSRAQARWTVRAAGCAAEAPPLTSPAD